MLLHPTKTVEIALDSSEEDDKGVEDCNSLARGDEVVFRNGKITVANPRNEPRNGLHLFQGDMRQYRLRKDLDDKTKGLTNTLSRYDRGTVEA